MDCGFAGLSWDAIRLFPDGDEVAAQTLHYEHPSFLHLGAVLRLGSSALERAAEL